MEAVTTQRNMCSHLVTVTCSGHHGACVVGGNLEEIGEESAVVLAERRISRGTHVCIRCGINRLRGVVEACRNDALGFFVEVHLDRASRWSQDWFSPEHLLMLGLLFGHKPSTKAITRKMASGY